jgi:UDP-N-acetylmuramoyl-L-alanyl-D-glutamate--2,6-diaminopimelate ligase
MFLSQLQAITQGTLTADVSFAGVSQALDNVKTGDLFVCVKGLRFDAHDIAKQAVEKGAVALVTERLLPLDVPQLIVPNTRSALSVVAACYYGVDKPSFTLVGITGTNGKTSTAYILQRIFSAAGKSAAYIGTLGVMADKLLLPPTLTTPDPLELMPLLSSLASRGVKYVFLEVSAHAAFLHKVDGLHFNSMIFTNLTQDHLDFFDTIEAYADAKCRLFDPMRTAMGVVNVDDACGRRLIAEGRVPMLTYGLDNPADIFAVNVRDTHDGLRFVVNAFDVVCDIASNLHGRFNVYNALAATAIAGYYGVGMRYVSSALADMRILGRFNIVDVNGVRFIIDYAHTPDGLKNSLTAARGQTEGKLRLVFGCGGDRDSDKRAKMGAVATRLADYVYITNDNPRSETPSSIAKGIEAGVSVDAAYTVILDREQAICEAYRASEAGDCVLIAGKGAETSMEIGGKKIPYSDYAVLEKLK